MVAHSRRSDGFDSSALSPGAKGDTRTSRVTSAEMPNDPDERAAALAHLRRLARGPEHEWARLFSDAAMRALDAGATLWQIHEAAEYVGVADGPDGDGLDGVREPRRPAAPRGGASVAAVVEPLTRLGTDRDGRQGCG